MKGCDIFCICHERQSILATIQPASQAGLCGFFKVALLKKKTKLLLIYLHIHTHTHTQSCSTFTLEPAVAPEGSSPFDLEFKGLGALATSLCKIRLSQLFFAAQAALGNVYYVGSAWTCSAGKHMEAEMCGRVMCCSPAGRISECEEE